ncbi:nitrite reductase small subunit NirD [Paraglaciecola sp. L3A3]|uniref:nitrite reductase small subunit NirD n=1 Tax=Paraglaciecola sp. L3A3 TaxID=2686358 RepID=UPI00131B8F08|nr:nitrite reductase small subunit NirD [Paraglaciecola sp. L3A3]
MTTQNDWINVCTQADLVSNSGVCALVNEQQIAIFKMIVDGQAQLFAVSNWCPFGKANVLYRGLLGSVENKKVIISPLYKQRFSLETGICLDDEAVKLTVYPIRIEQDQVQLKLAD